MLIKTLNIDGFRGVNRLTIEPAKRVTLLVGENGTGKTAVLDGLAAALAGLVGSMRQEPPGEILPGLFCPSDHERRWPSRPSGPPVWQRALRIDVAALWDDLFFEWTARSSLLAGGAACEARLLWSDAQHLEHLRAKLYTAARDRGVLPLVAVLPAERGRAGGTSAQQRPFFAKQSENAQRRATRPAMPHCAAYKGRAPGRLRGKCHTAFPNGRRTEEISFDPGPNERLEQWGAHLRLDLRACCKAWVRLEAQAPFLNATAQAALHTVRAALTRALAIEERPWYSADAQDVLIKRPGEGGWRAVGCLGDGEGSFVRTVVALALRCADSNQGHVDAAACTPGAVLIDEVEQHLHPALQRNILRDLCAAFPKLQIIATTHAPLLLAGALSGEDRVLRLREEGEVAVTPLLAPCGKDAAQVLTGAWFGLASTLDDETLRMMAEHRALLRSGPSARDARQQLEETLRTRLGRYAETSIETLALSMVAALEGDARLARIQSGLRGAQEGEPADAHR